ncbi:MAG: YdcF family protein [Desulfatiglans sp.]|nr:YdcF family protein [Desulfatiglans sp.]
MTEQAKKRRGLKAIAVMLILAIAFVFLFHSVLLKQMGEFLIRDDIPIKSDAALVLNTGLEYYPRLIEAADIYKKGLAERIIINGDRKTDSLRYLEAQGFTSCCTWYEDSMRILEMLGVPRHSITAISAEDAYDTNTEAEDVGTEIIALGYNRIILITSRFHTRRAAHIWKEMYEGKLDVISVSAKTDPFDPASWWKDGRQIRWVLSEYGSWIFYYWKKVTNI